MSDQEPEESPRGAAAEAPPGEVSEEEMEGAKKHSIQDKRGMEADPQISC